MIKEKHDMSENLINFWEKWIDGEDNIDVTSDGIILKYSMINRKINDGVKDWVCFDSKDKLFSFIKYLLLPSIQITRSIGIRESEVYLDVCDYDKTIKLLETFKINGYEQAIVDYKRWLEELEIIENNKYNFESIRSFINKISSEVNIREDTFLELHLFENIKSVGNLLIKQYEDDNMLDILESKFELSKDEIEDLFESIDNNKFMLKKMLILLNERYI
jgi:chaperonin cofactor prefoldin